MSYSYNSKPLIKTILVGIQRQLDTDAHFKNSIDELGCLAETLGWSVEGRLTQRREDLRLSTALGSGKLDELKKMVESAQEVEEVSQDYAKKERKNHCKEELEHEVVVLFNDILTPMQFRIIGNVLGVEVFDRTGVILEIFRERAQTREAKIQVELAHLRYIALRMAETRGKDMDQQAGGIGAKGLGEAAHKLEKRHVRRRSAQLRRELTVIAKRREHRCSRRHDVSGVALVGYTNAGKSSWMRALTGEDVFIKDRLFATLETTIRELKSPSQKQILLSDTVGFIEDLPHDLVASFRSTLEEARQASLLLHVVDASSPNVESQISTTQEVLCELEAERIPQFLLFNKVDLMTSERREMLELLYPKAFFVSTHQSKDVEAIREALISFFAGQVVEESIFVPYEKHHLLAKIYDTMDVLQLSHEDEGSQLLVRAFSSAFWYIERILGPQVVSVGA